MTGRIVEVSPRQAARLSLLSDLQVRLDGFSRPR